jgi:hypothetical protein
VCASCRPQLPRCPECRATYPAMDRHRYAERDAEHLLRLERRRAEVADEA